MASKRRRPRPRSPRRSRPRCRASRGSRTIRASRSSTASSRAGRCWRRSAPRASRARRRAASCTRSTTCATWSASALGAITVLTVARDKASGRVVAYHEIASSPTDVWQGHEETLADGASLVPRQALDLPSGRVRVRRAFVVGADLRGSLAEAGLAPVEDVLSMLDDALEGHAELSDASASGSRAPRRDAGARRRRLRARWASLDAVEYFPATPNAAPVRVYYAGGDEEHGTHGDHRGWFDAKGRQALQGRLAHARARDAHRVALQPEPHAPGAARHHAAQRRGLHPARPRARRSTRRRRGRCSPRATAGRAATWCRSRTRGR